MPADPAVLEAPAWTLDRARILGAAACETLAVGLVTGFRPALLAEHPAFLLLVPALALAAVAVVDGRRAVRLLAGFALAFVPLLSGFVTSAVAGEIVFDPRAPPEFVAILLMGSAFLLAAPPAYRALLGDAPRAAVDELRSPTGFALLAVAAAVLGAAGSSVVAYTHAADEARRGAFDVPADARLEMGTSGLRFVPELMTVGAGVVTEIEIENPDPVLHTLSYSKDGREIRQDLLPGTTTRFLVRFPEAGNVPFWCDPHSPDHASGMVGVFVVA